MICRKNKSSTWVKINLHVGILSCGARVLSLKPISTFSKLDIKRSISIEMACRHDQKCLHMYFGGQGSISFKFHLSSSMSKFRHVDMLPWRHGSISPATHFLDLAEARYRFLLRYDMSNFTLFGQFRHECSQCSRAYSLERGRIKISVFLWIR